MNKILKSSGFILLVILLLSCKKDKPTPPEITTKAVSEITASSANSGGTISTDGGSAIITTGVCWNTGIEPTIKDGKTTDHLESGSFTSSITGLEGGTNYYVRAYATNSAGTGYGTAMSFTTLGQAPTASTETATNITATSATLNSSVNANYLSTTVIFEYGTSIEYGETITASQSPINGNISTIISSDLTGLNPGTTYHFRIKTENSRGTIYGSDLTFITLGQLPSATTLSASGVTVSVATLNGLVNANDLSTVITFEYGKTIDYGNTAVALQSPITGHSNISVNTFISGLTEGTSYHFRIKSVNSLGLVYGNDLVFTTLGQAPTISVLPSTNILFYSATLMSKVNPNYLLTTVTVEYGTTLSYGNTLTTSQNPLEGNLDINVNLNLTTLSAGTTYHYRVKAVNILGTTYSNDQIFSTIPTTISDYDGNIYNVVIIGNQAWTIENLKTTRYNDGSNVSLVTDNTVWNNTSLGAFCWYNNDESTNKNTYGALYNWYAGVTNKLCPTGWHVPTNSQLLTLINYLGTPGIVGGKLKETGTVHWLTPNTGATNESGFTALPGGNRDYNGIYSALNGYGMWWSTTADINSNTVGLFIVLYSNSSSVSYNTGSDKHIGNSVRCLKDN